MCSLSGKMYESVLVQYWHEYTGAEYWLARGACSEYYTDTGWSEETVKIYNSVPPAGSIVWAKFDDRNSIHGCITLWSILQSIRWKVHLYIFDFSQYWNNGASQKCVSFSLWFNKYISLTKKDDLRKTILVEALLKL